MDLKNSLIDPRTAIQELARGRELVAELSSHLQEEFWPDELAGGFCKGIMEAFEKGIPLVESLDVTVAAEVHSPTPVMQAIHSPRNGRRHSESGDPNPQRQKTRRRTYSKTTVTDSPFSDGCQWRKYGQKMIQNVKYPRSYYKCTRTDCDAKLLVEQIVDSGGLPMYKVTRNNEHTCNTGDLRSVSGTCSPTTPTGSRFISFESNQSVASFDRGASERVHHHFSSSSSQQIRDRGAGTFSPRSSDTSSSLLLHPSVPAQLHEAFWTESSIMDSHGISSPPLSPAGQFYDASAYL